MNIIYLHIGAHKTASSYIQTLLNANKAILSASRIRLIKRSDMMELKFYKTLQAKLEGEQGTIDEEVKKEIRELASFDGNLIFTNEDMFKNLGIRDFYNNIDTGIRFFQESFPDHEIKVIFYVRNQVDYIESVYTQYVHLGRNISFESFTREGNLFNLDWNNVCQTIENVIGGNNLVVIPYESIKTLGSEGFYNEFLTVIECNTEGHSFAEVNGRQSNRSFSSIAMDIFKLAAPNLNKQDKKKLRTFLQNEFSTATHKKKEIMNEQTKIMLKYHYFHNNKKLVARFYNWNKDNNIIKIYVSNNFGLSYLEKAILKMKLFFKIRFGR
ncbi:hypothetical protein AB4341_16595 [Vibrio breoganii]